MKKPPSQEFKDALEDMRRFWSRYNQQPMSFYQGTDEEFIERSNMEDSKLANLKRLVLAEGLVEIEAKPRAKEDNDNAMEDFIFKQVYGCHTKCKECSQLMMGYSEILRHDCLCFMCQEEKDKHEYYEWQSKNRSDLENKIKRYPVLEYCDKIRDIDREDLSRTYEEDKAQPNLTKQYREEMKQEYLEDCKILAGKIPKPKPEGISKTKWERQQRRIRKNIREKHKQEAADQKLESEGTPQYHLREQIDEIGCECKAEEIRAGNFCDTCRLLFKVDQYMIDLFKRESEGRGTIL